MLLFPQRTLDEQAQSRRRNRLLVNWADVPEVAPKRPTWRDRLGSFWKPPLLKPSASSQGWVEAIAAQQAAGTLFNTYTTAKTVINPQALFTLVPNFWYPGRSLRITVMGGLSNIVTTPGTVTFQVMMGTIVAYTSGAIQLNATAHTTLPFWADIIVTCRTVGSGTAATLMGMGQLNGIMFTLTAAQVDAVNTPGAFPAPATLPAVGTGFDSTVSNVLDFWVGFSISNAGNGVQVQNYIVEVLN